MCRLLGLWRQSPVVQRAKGATHLTSFWCTRTASNHALKHEKCSTSRVKTSKCKRSHYCWPSNVKAPSTRFRPIFEWTLCLKSRFVSSLPIKASAPDVLELTIGASREEMLGLCLLPCSESDWTVGHLCGAAIKSCGGEKTLVTRITTELVVRQRHWLAYARSASLGGLDTLSRDAPRLSQPRPPREGPH